jgi:hypothetical protein
MHEQIRTLVKPAANGKPSGGKVSAKRKAAPKSVVRRAAGKAVGKTARRR